MKREKVQLGTSNRPRPSTGYVRKRLGNGPEALDVRTPKTDNRGVITPPLRRGDNTRPSQFDEKTGSDAGEGILAAWRRLDPMQRRNTLALMSLELQKGNDEESRDVDLWCSAVYSALSAVIGPSDGPGHGPQVVRRVIGASAAWTPVAEFVQVGRLGSLRPAEKLAVFHMLAKLLVMRAKRVAERAEIPLTPKLVAQNAQHIAGIFDNAFPGYLANGLIGSVARMLIGKPAALSPRVYLNDE